MKKQVVLKDRTYRLKGKTASIVFILNSRNSRRKPLLHFDGKQNRALRYSSNQSSPFQDDQDDNAIIEPVVFEDGMLFVPKTNPVLQEFLSLHPGNGTIFEEVDNEKDATVEVEILDAQIDAQVAAKNLDIDMLETIGRIALGLNVDKMSTSELKRDVRLYARNSPEDFLDTLNDPMLKIQKLASDCMSQGLLSIRNKGKDVYFNLPQNKKKLLSIPFGDTAIQALAMFFQTDDGIELMSMLENKLED
jgi:hypothetical protein